MNENNKVLKRSLCIKNLETLNITLRLGILLLVAKTDKENLEPAIQNSDDDEEDEEDFSHLYSLLKCFRKL